MSKLVTLYRSIHDFITLHFSGYGYRTVWDAPVWRKEWDELADYNAGRRKGHMYDPEYVNWMKHIQREFDEAHGIQTNK